MDKRKMEWTRVNYNKPRRRYLRPVDKWWNGFDSEGRERWFIELNNGVIINDRDNNYSYWLQKYLS